MKQPNIALTLTRPVASISVFGLLLMSPPDVGAQRPLYSSASIRSGMWFSYALNAGNFVDVDRDGAPDVLVSGSLPRGVGPTDAKFTLYLNDGSGHVRDVRYGLWPPPAGSAFGGVAAHGDLNGDGNVDVLVVGIYGTTMAPAMAAFEGDGLGNFVYSSGIQFHPQLGAVLSGQPQIRDLDGDGDVDVLITLVGGPGMLYLNDGHGLFRELTGALPASLSGGTMRFADFDRDGDMDIAFGMGIVFTNDGHGMFQQVAVLPGWGAVAMDVGDVTGDGYDDILFAPYAPTMQLYVNDGSGSFVDEFWRFQVSWPTNPTRGQAQVIDLDGDGDLDIYAQGQPVEAYLNDGTGNFTDGLATLGLSQQTGFYMVDMDRDGDLDIWRSGNILNEARWSPGLLTSILANDPPLGGTLGIELRAPPGRRVSYLLGFARLDAFIPGIGWSALDPSLTVPWPATATVPASGLVTTSLSVPNVAGLRGMQFHLQGVDVDFTSGSIHAMNVWPVTIR